MGYKMYKGVTSTGHDIKFVGRLPIEELVMICDDMLNAVGFTTTGYIKYNIDVTTLVLGTDDVYIKETTIDRNDPSFGFIITRHVNSDVTNKYWQECYKCIRRFWDNHIVIIDDNSDKSFVTDAPKEFVNYTIVKSEFPKRGELLGYYYFYKLGLFKRAVIIHDSIFIKMAIDFAAVKEPIKLLWHATHEWDNNTMNIELLGKLNNSEELIRFYKDNKNWTVCFGVMSMIDYDFLNELQERYNFFALLEHINNRQQRMYLERIFGCICCYNYYKGPIDSLFGFINQYIDPLNYDDHVKDEKFLLRWTDYEKAKDNFSLHVVKVYSGR